SPRNGRPTSTRRVCPAPRRFRLTWKKCASPAPSRFATGIRSKHPLRRSRGEDRMASQPPTHKTGAPDSGAPRSSIFGTFTRVLNVLGTLLILAMVVAVNADVGGRNMFNHPIAGVIEFVGLSIVAVVFL